MWSPDRTVKQKFRVTRAYNAQHAYAAEYPPAHEIVI
jgi:hypothetical protein